MENYKDNWLTKDDLSYDQLYHQLLDIMAKLMLDYKAYVSK